MTTLLLVDIQNDFHPGGSLAIPAAGDDAVRTAAFIRKHATHDIKRIVASLDSHHKLHIAHPCFWTSGDTGAHPAPFTLITMSDIKAGKWIPRQDLKLPTRLVNELEARLKKDGDVSVALYRDDGTLDSVQYCIEYAKRLEEKGRFQICVWPEHCLVGSSGHNVVGVVMEAIQEWSNSTGGSVEWVLKGQNNLTEMYSAMAAEVPVCAGTEYNQDLFHSLKANTDKLVICGQALSHCVNYTTRDIVAKWPKDEMHRVTLLEDCCSSVGGFESAGEQFLSDMRAVGVKVETSDTML